MKRLLNVEIVYSEQAQKLINNLKDFQKEKFESEYFKTIIVGDRLILDWLFRGGK